MMRNTHESFGLISKVLHWSMAILLIGLFTVGLYMTGLDYYDPLYHSLPWWHKSIGLLVIGLWLFRLIWKLTNRTPQVLITHKKWEVSLAHLMQNLFYGLILLIGISGYLMSTAKGKSIEFFNLIEVPAALSKINEETADLIGEMHELLAILLAAFVILHALAAVKHHFIDKDETLKRML